MKSRRLALSFAILASLTASAFAESDAQKSFDKLKTLSGSWEGKNASDRLQVTFRVTSNGSAIMSEMVANPDDMITMFNLDGDRLILTHYCASGNQPRMLGKLSPDGKTMNFDFLDGTNLNSAQAGHMHHLVLTIYDANHHSEDFTFLSPDGKQQEHEHFDLHRATVRPRAVSAHTLAAGK
jgi:hypothetical protein